MKIHPGKILLDELYERQMTFEELANKTDISLDKIRDIIHGLASITQDSSRQIGGVLGINTEILYNLQRQYDSN